MKSGFFERLKSGLLATGKGCHFLTQKCWGTWHLAGNCWNPGSPYRLFWGRPLALLSRAGDLSVSVCSTQHLGPPASSNLRASKISAAVATKRVSAGGFKPHLLYREHWTALFLPRSRRSCSTYQRLRTKAGRLTRGHQPKSSWALQQSWDKRV